MTQHLVTVDVLSLVRETYAQSMASLVHSKAMDSQKRELVLSSLSAVGRSLVQSRAARDFDVRFVGNFTLAVDVTVLYQEDGEPVRIRLHAPDDPEGKQLEIAVKHMDLLKRQAQIASELKALQDECGHTNVVKKHESNTGNWDPHDNQYWIDYTCPDCGKHWTEEN